MKLEHADKNRFHFDIDYWDEPRAFEAVSLVQIGDIGCSSGFVLNSHVQKCFEVGYIVSGKGWVVIDDVRYPVKQGDLYICFPPQKHSAKADTDNPFRYLYMGFIFNRHPFEEDSFIHIQKMLQKIDNPVMQDRFDIHTPFSQVMNEIYKSGEFAELLIKSYLYEIVIKAYRDFCSDWEYKYELSQKLDGNQSIVYNVISYIDNNIDSIDELKQIAKLLGYSYSYLSHVFSEETGLTLQTYLVQKKIEKAAELLNSNELTIAMIAERLQYQSVHSFGKAFKKIMGVSPAKYQQLQRQK
jgi:AraC-like DNA-binding protein